MTEQQLSYQKYPPEFFLPVLDLKEVSTTSAAEQGSFLVYCVLRALIENEYRIVHPNARLKPVCVGDPQIINTEVMDQLMSILTKFMLDLHEANDIAYSPEILQYADYMAMKAVFEKMHPDESMKQKILEEQAEKDTEIIDEIFSVESALS